MVGASKSGVISYGIGSLYASFTWRISNYFKPEWPVSVSDLKW